MDEITPAGGSRCLVLAAAVEDILKIPVLSSSWLTDWTAPIVLHKNYCGDREPPADLLSLETFLRLPPPPHPTPPHQLSSRASSVCRILGSKLPANLVKLGSNEPAGLQSRPMQFWFKSAIFYFWLLRSCQHIEQHLLKILELLLNERHKITVKLDKKLQCCLINLGIIGKYEIIYFNDRSVGCKKHL